MNLISELIKSAHEKGILRTIRIIFAHIQDLAFDLKYQTDTFRWQELNGLSVVGQNKAHAVYYQPTQARTLRKVFKTGNLPQEGAFLDLGCGKGRTLILAAEFGYAQVLGVEFSESLCQIARSNLSHYIKRHLMPTEFQIIHADAADYTIPQYVSTIFLFNPFDQVVMTRVVRNIKESLRHYSRKLYVIYRNPVHRNVFDNSATFHLIAQHSFPQCDFLVYETVNS